MNIIFCAFCFDKNTNSRYVLRDNHFLLKSNASGSYFGKRIFVAMLLSLVKQLGLLLGIYLVHFLTVGLRSKATQE